MLKTTAINLILDGKTLLKDINLTMRQGSFLCIAGKNGGGKTLLLKVLSGILKPTSGTVMLDGEDIKDYKPKTYSQKVQYMPAQQFCAFGYNVQDIIVMGRAGKLNWYQNYSAADYNATQASAKKTDVLHLFGQDITTLSTGELQRVFIAQALCAGAGYILLDEPTSHLDLKQKHLILQLLKEAAQNGIGIAMVCHDVELAKQYADSFCFIKNGTIFNCCKTAICTQNIINQTYDL